MGGGTAGFISALYFLNKNKKLNLNLKIKLISSKDIDPIGVGEGTTPLFVHFIRDICKIDEKEFLRETKGSFKFAIRYNNWNFDNGYYYHPFGYAQNYQTDLNHENKDLDIDFIQYAINNDINIPQKILQKKLYGIPFDLLENNKISLSIFNGYAYHISAKLLVPFLMKKCLEFDEFEHIQGTICKVNYKEDGFIKNIFTDDDKKIDGDFYINCLGFKSSNILNEEYFNFSYWDNYLLNNSAFAIQVKNSPLEDLDIYTTATAQEYGWCWKIPQYEKTGYGYVYSDQFVNDEDKLYHDIIKTYNIKEKDVFKTKLVKSKPYYNRKQIHKNCLSIGLSSGFIEPLEANSIHLSLISLGLFFEMIESEIEFNEKYLSIFNDKLEKQWTNMFKFIVFHYFTNNPINDYWKHYKNIQMNNTFEFYEKSSHYGSVTFSKISYYFIGLGMNLKDYSCYNFCNEKYLKENVNDYFKISTNLDIDKLYSQNLVLKKINQTPEVNFINYH